MITLDFENLEPEEIKTLDRLAKENNLTIVKDEVMNFDAAEVMSIMGNTAQIVALLITLSQLYGKHKRVSYHSDTVDQDNMSLEAARQLAERDK